MRDCQSCLHNTAGGCNSWKCEYINRNEAAEAYRQTRWIPVTVRVPETDEMMLVSCRTKKGVNTTNRAYYDGDMWHGSGTMSGVTAWMPLPAPYQEEVRDEKR